MLDEWWEEDVATTADEVRRRHADNKASWEQAAGHYQARTDADVALLRAGGSTVHPIERRELLEHAGPFADWCHRAIHLQCASGRDTLSLLNEGVREVVGIDISESHIANARARSVALGADATWFACDVLDAPAELDGTADLVYTGRGAIGWVHDLAGWAAVVHRLLKRGGWLCLFDDHPTSFLFDPDEGTVTYNGIAYFDSATAGRGWQASYIDELPVADRDLAVHHDRIWTFEEIFHAVTGAGLELVRLGEYAEPYYAALPHVPDGEQRRIPQTFLVLARRR